ncbi:hypothetical protein IWW52_006673, partial [Coemansia sp. RSA 2704]
MHYRRRKRQRSRHSTNNGTKSGSQYVVDMEDQYYDPVPRYSPTYRTIELSSQTGSQIHTATPDLPVTVPEAVACRASAHHMPPPYITRLPSEES